MIGRLFSNGGLRSAASSRRIWVGDAEKSDKVSEMVSLTVSVLRGLETPLLASRSCG